MSERTRRTKRAGVAEQARSGRAAAADPVRARRAAGVRAPSTRETTTAAPQHAGCTVSCMHPEAVALARAAVPEPACVDRASELLKAVADPTRIRLLAALAATELCVCDLSAIAGISESAVSHQLRVLREQQLVTFRKDGRVVYYRLLDDHVMDLMRSAVEHAREATARPASHEP